MPELDKREGVEKSLNNFYNAETEYSITGHSLVDDRVSLISLNNPNLFQ